MIARKERRDVALEVAGQLDRRHEPTAPVMLPSHGYYCKECGQWMEWLTNTHAQGHGYDSRADMLRQGAAVKCTVSHGAHRKGA